MGAVYLLPGANAIATGDLVLARLEEIAKTLPDGMAYKAWWTPTTLLWNPSKR